MIIRTSITEYLLRYWQVDIRKSTSESRRTDAGKSINLILTASTMFARITSALVDVRLATITWKGNRINGKQDN